METSVLQVSYWVSESEQATWTLISTRKLRNYQDLFRNKEVFAELMIHIYILHRLLALQFLTTFEEKLILSLQNLALRRFLFGPLKVLQLFQYYISLDFGPNCW
jgi:hypothetical protein